jgi:hypothetical protein
MRPNPRERACGRAFRRSLRLIPGVGRVKSVSLSQNNFDAQPVTAAVHRYQELIAGHPYLIEVSSVTTDRWRAYIVRLPGMPTALMPFYGATPDAAAGQLREWLTRAHERAGTTRAVHPQ